MGKPAKQRIYIRKSITGPPGWDEWVVRIKTGAVDLAVCGCPSFTEAFFVKQCVAEAIASPTRSERLKNMLSELIEP